MGHVLSNVLGELLVPRRIPIMLGLIRFHTAQYLHTCLSVVKSEIEVGSASLHTLHVW